MYKMVVISKELWEENNAEVIVDKNGELWLNEDYRRTITS